MQVARTKSSTKAKPATKRKSKVPTPREPPPCDWDAELIRHHLRSEAWRRESPIWCKRRGCNEAELVLAQQIVSNVALWVATGDGPAIERLAAALPVRSVAMRRNAVLSVLCGAIILGGRKSAKDTIADLDRQDPAFGKLQPNDLPHALGGVSLKPDGGGKHEAGICRAAALLELWAGAFGSFPCKRPDDPTIRKVKQSWLKVWRTHWRRSPADSNR